MPQALFAGVGREPGLGDQSSFEFAADALPRHVRVHLVGQQVFAAAQRTSGTNGQMSLLFVKRSTFMCRKLPRFDTSQEQPGAD